MNIKEEIKKALYEVIDPELGINIVDLGLIYHVYLDDATNDITVHMTLTTPGCPMASSIKQGVQLRLEQIKSIGKVTVNITFEPPWTPGRMSEKGRMMLQQR